jgi:nucleoside-diphosphate-sugar epimerase
MGVDRRSLVLLTGASGYIGGRLLKALEKASRPVRCLARRPLEDVQEVSNYAAAMNNGLCRLRESFPLSSR